MTNFAVIVGEKMKKKKWKKGKKKKENHKPTN